jgi:hypothetical protein
VSQLEAMTRSCSASTLVGATGSNLRCSGVQGQGKGFMRFPDPDLLLVRGLIAPVPTCARALWKQDRPIKQRPLSARTSSLLKHCGEQQSGLSSLCKLSPSCEVSLEPYTNRNRKVAGVTSHCRSK